MASPGIEVNMAVLADDPTVVQRLFDHIDNKTTDTSEASWREPVANYRSPERLAAELDLLRRVPVPFCPSAALPANGSYVARQAAGVPLLVVRGADGRVRALRNACRHRGALLADGSGCAKAFVCRYHGWTYGLDGALRHVPHEHGFPGLDKQSRGLVPVWCEERSGVVFVSQDRAAGADAERMPPLIAPRWRLLIANESEVNANWKILVETFLEGYHIRTTHPESFYPLQYDNLNVVETFGRNSRIAFPYRAIEKLRGVPPAQRSAERTLTYVYHLFPNAMVATFPANLFLIILEPLAVDRTMFVTYVLGTEAEPTPAAPERSGRHAALLDAGATEDRAVACAIQRGLASGANEFFEFGRFEGAIGHFHRTLHDMLASNRG